MQPGNETAKRAIDKKITDNTRVTRRKVACDDYDEFIAATYFVVAYAARE